MARVLWLTAQVPDRGLGGGNIRQAHLLAAVAASHEVHLAVIGTLTDDGLRRSVRELTELPVPAPAPAPGRPGLAHLATFVQRRPEDCVAGSAAVEALRSVVDRERDVDIVCVEHGALAPLLPPRRRATWTITLHYLASRQAEQIRRIGPGVAARTYWAREAAKSRRLERWVAASYDRTFVCSDEDADRLRPRADVVPNGVDLDAFGSSPLPDAPTIVFTGTLDYRPNVEGLQWFCDAVLPLVRRQRPDAALQVVGRGPSPAVRELARRPGVQLHADVPSVAPFLLGSRVVVVPLRIGSGTRIKALEAMAARRPLVGTTVGLAGLGLVDGVHARIVDDAPGFASAVLDALDVRREPSTVAEARRLVEDRFSWVSIGRRHADRLAALAAAREPERA